MRLYIGGYGQGKLRYVLNKVHTEEVCIVDEKNYKDYIDEISNKYDANSSISKMNNAESTLIVNHVHLIVRDMLKQVLGIDEIETEIMKLVDIDGSVVICDEIGNGLIPMERFEREYRDAVGEILQKLASKAAMVTRLVCGIGMVIKYDSSYNDKTW